MEKKNFEKISKNLYDKIFEFIDYEINLHLSFYSKALQKKLGLSIDDFQSKINGIYEVKKHNQEIQILNYSKDNEKELRQNVILFLDNQKIVFSFKKTFQNIAHYYIKIKFIKTIIMKNIFKICKNLISIDFSHFKLKSKNISFLLCGCSSLKNVNFDNFNTEKVEYMNNMFQGCSLLKEINLSNFNTQNVKNMKKMFSGCCNLEKIDLSNFNTCNVINMSCMFEDCHKIETINLESFNTSKVKNMSSMFRYCNKLINLNLKNFNTENVLYMTCMFGYCSSLDTINISNFKYNNIISKDYMWEGTKINY